jgi:hypothetical protein
MYGIYFFVTQHLSLPIWEHLWGVNVVLSLVSPCLGGIIPGINVLIGGWAFEECSLRIED